MAKLLAILKSVVPAFMAFALLMSSVFAGGYLKQWELGTIEIVSSSPGFTVSGEMKVLSRQVRPGETFAKGTITVTNVTEVNRTLVMDLDIGPGNEYNPIRIQYRVVGQTVPQSSDADTYNPYSLKALPVTFRAGQSQVLDISIVVSPDAQTGTGYKYVALNLSDGTLSTGVGGSTNTNGQ